MSKVFNLKGSGKIGDIVQINAENTVKKSHTYPEFDFLQRINSSKKSIGMCSISDLDGNVYIVGQFEDTAFSNNILLNTETASKSGIFIAQLDKNGEWTWARKILEYEGPIDISSNFDIKIIKNNIYIGGTVSSKFTYNVLIKDFISTEDENGFICKFDKGGNIKYLTTFGGEKLGILVRLSVDGKDNVYYINSYQGRLNLTPTIVLPDLLNLNSKQLSESAYIVKLDKKGDFVWAKDLSIPDDIRNISFLEDIVTTKKGRSIVTGGYLGKIQLDDKILKCHDRYSSSDTCSYSCDYTLTSDYTDSETYGDCNRREEGLGCFLMAEIDKHGCWVRERHFEGGRGLALSFDNCNNLILSGLFEKEYELGKRCYKNQEEKVKLFVTKLDKNWVTDWFFSFVYNQENINMRINLVLDECDDIYIGGEFEDPTRIGTDLLIAKNGIDNFVFKLSSNGCFQWSFQITNVLETFSLSVDPFGNIYIAIGFTNPLLVMCEEVGNTYFETLGLIKIKQSFPKLIGVITEVVKDKRECETCTLEFCSCSETECSQNLNHIEECSEVKVIFQGYADAFSKLKPGKDYYLDTEGYLTLDDGFRYLGTATSSTELYLK